MEDVLRILGEIRPDVDFANEAALIDDGMLDSLDLINLMTKLDEELGVTVPFTELTPENLNSAASIAALIERCR